MACCSAVRGCVRFGKECARSLRRHPWHYSRILCRRRRWGIRVVCSDTLVRLLCVLMGNLSGDYLQIVAGFICDTHAHRGGNHCHDVVEDAPSYGGRYPKIVQTYIQNRTPMGACKTCGELLAFRPQQPLVFCFGFYDFRARCRTTTRTCSCLFSRPSAPPRELGRTPARYGTRICTYLSDYVHGCWCWCTFSISLSICQVDPWTILECMTHVRCFILWYLLYSNRKRVKNSKTRCYCNTTNGPLRSWPDHPSRSWRPMF